MWYYYGRLQLLEEATTHCFDSCIHGYHVYKDIWTASPGEILACQNEFGNILDPYAVAVVTSSNTTVGHVPRVISAVWLLQWMKKGPLKTKVLS